MAMSSTSFDYFRALVHAKSAIAIDDTKEYLVETRLAPLAGVHGFRSLDDMASALSRTSPGPIHRAVVESMTTNETSFFRDVHPFDALRSRVLPALIADRRPVKRLNIWCAASSTGQEPYSIAMLLREDFPELRDWTIRLLATDLSSSVLTRARTGRYSELEVSRGLPAPYLTKYFAREDSEWRIRADIRTMVEFRELNLVEPWPAIDPLDIVFLRNVLIYFDVATKREILRRVRAVARPGAYLFLGSAESTLTLDDEIVRLRGERGVVYQFPSNTPP